MTSTTFVLETSPRFVGRRDELKLFSDVLGALKTGRTTLPQFLHFWGTAGIGKTTLLKEYLRLCRQRSVAVAYVSFEEERMKDEVEEPYAEALFIIATQLARLGIGEMRQLLDKRAAFRPRERSQNLEERQAALQALKEFPNEVLEELVAIADKEPVVLLIDGLEDSSESVRAQLESHLLLRFAEAPLAMVVSASRATLPVTWSDELRGRFDRFHVLPFSSQEVDQFLNDVSPTRPLPNVQVILTGPLMSYVREIGRGHLVVTQAAIEFLDKLLTRAKEEDKKDPGTIHELDPDQKRELQEYLRCSYLEPYALRDLDRNSWAGRVYRAIVPTRYFDVDSLKLLLRACGVERRAEETEQLAADLLEERGLIYWSPPGVYQLDLLPRDLLVRWMEYFEPQTLHATTKALVNLYRLQVFAKGDVPDRPLATVEYLYHLYHSKQQDDISQPRIETEILEELRHCLTQNRSPQAINTLWRYLRDDDELAQTLGPALKFRMIAEVERSGRVETGAPTFDLAQEKQTLIHEALSKNCILFLGPGLTLGPNYLGMYEILARRLAEEIGFTDVAARFEDMAQYYVNDPSRGSNKLVTEVLESVESLLNPDSASLDAIVSLPFHTIVTTAIDTSLEGAYDHARWPLEVVVSPTASPKIERGEDLLIKLCGSTDRPDSLVLTRHQHLQLRTNLAGADNLVGSYLRAGVPLFMGFSLHDPLLYFLHMLVHDVDSPSAGKSYIALDEAVPFLSEAWQTDLVILGQSGRDLLKEIQEQWQNWQNEKMRNWSGAEVLEEIRAQRPVAGKRMSRIELEEGTDLQGQDLRNCVITSGMLNGVLLNDALLDRTDMSNVALEDAQLKGCRAHGINLTNARANRAKLSGAQFNQAQFTGAVMQDVEITGTVFAESDLIYTDLRGARGDAPAFMSANLSIVELSGAQLPGAIFRDSLIWGGKFKRARLPKADFRLANLAKAEFEGADLTGANFYFANLVGADFSGTDVRGADFGQALLEGADFHDAVNVLEANFVGATWQEANLPAELRSRLEQIEADELQARSPTGKLAELAHEVMNGRCILFVGPGLTLGSHYLETYDTIRMYLAEECGLAGSQGGLGDVAQYYAAKTSPDKLIERVSKEILSSLQLDETSLDLIVSLPFDVVVTTTVDTSLEEAYGRARRRYERAVSLYESPIVEQGEDLLIRLCGGIGIPSLPLVLTRRDRLHLQAKLAQSDSLLLQYASIRAPLFLGFSLRDPMLYVLHTLVSQPDAPLAGKSFVALDDPHPFLGEAWRTEGLLVLDRSSRQLLEELQGQWFERRGEELRIWSTAEVLEAVQTGRPMAGKRMGGIVLEEGTDLQGQDLRNCVITSGALNGVLLNDALLNAADLSNVEMEDAQLSRCRLLGVNMVRAKANRARFDNADLGKAVLIYAALEDVDLTGARLAEADLIFADLQGAFGEGADFMRARLSNALLSGARLPGATFRDSFCTAAEFKRAELPEADFQMANLADAKLEGANLVSASFRSANLTGADFSGADVRGADFSQARLDGTDLYDAKNVLEADFTGAAWQEAKLPEELRQKLEQSEAESRAT